jgi:protein-S-isoprenylcysteine O-methyltransferase Ste14
MDHRPLRLAGAGLMVAGIGLSLAAQWKMGETWRGDVDPSVKGRLVTTGLFRVVRNPILTGTFATALGLALLVPNLVALVMLVAFAVAMQVQVRLVEEPYLLRVHGDTYRAYAARTGRFLPGIGRMARDLQGSRS